MDLLEQLCSKLFDLRKKLKLEMSKEMRLLVANLLIHAVIGLTIPFAVPCILVTNFNLTMSEFGPSSILWWHQVQAGIITKTTALEQIVENELRFMRESKYVASNASKSYDFEKHKRT